VAEDDVALSLLEQVSLPGYRASIIATYNCYLPFYEQVVLRRLMAKGCAHNILLMIVWRSPGSAGEAPNV
jgi:hypothetical protein